MDEQAMDIGQPTDVRHVAHVTFDRFNGFLGLPSEFEPEVPRKAPSASAKVFGVSTQSMQLSYDSRGNCVPVILLLMQSSLYAQGGLQAEGIFRIAAENTEEEYVREQLNRGVIPEGIDVHCLAGLIKAWFRELPTGVLDPLSPDQVMQCETEEDFVKLMRLLPQTEASLLSWAINLMADVAQHEHLNKMNSRNIALVFAPNMSRMADPLTALMYAVQVMNLVKTLIEKTLRDREAASSRQDPSHGNRHEGPYESCDEDSCDDDNGNNRETEHASNEKEDEEAEDEVFSEQKEARLAFREEEEDKGAKEKLTRKDKEELAEQEDEDGEVPIKEKAAGSGPRNETPGKGASENTTFFQKPSNLGSKNVPETTHFQLRQLPVPAISNSGFEECSQG